MMKRKTIFDILREADEDSGTDNTTDVGQDEAPSPEESGEDASDDDFNIDTNLDNGDGEDEGGDDFGDDTGDSSSDTSSDLSSDDSSEEKPVQANTDIFASLSPEEQKMKIMELKNLYAELYSSADDILERLNQTNTNEDSIEIMGKITSSLYSIRQYLSDYITQVFPVKSFIENDINFNRFLAIVNGIATIIEEIGAIKIANMKKS